MAVFRTVKNGPDPRNIYINTRALIFPTKHAIENPILEKKYANLCKLANYLYEAVFHG